jgi:hypothetical protein
MLLIHAKPSSTVAAEMPEAATAIATQRVYLWRLLSANLP